MLKYAVLVVLLCFIAVIYAQAPVATNTTDAPPKQQGGVAVPVAGRKNVAGKDVFVTPPNATYNSLPVIADKGAIAGLPQNQIAVYFTNGEAKYVQNVPQPYAQGPEIKIAQNSNCFDGVETGDEVCDYGLNTCCDVNNFCHSYLKVGNSCNGGNAIIKTAANLKCFDDACAASGKGAETTCKRTNKPVDGFVTPKRTAKRGRGKRAFRARRAQKTGTVCYPPELASTSRRLEVRGNARKRFRSKRTGNRKHSNKRNQPTKFYCDGTGKCPCTGCPTTAVL